MSDLNDEKLVPRGNGRLPVLQVALAPDTPGSVEWTANSVFGGRLEFKKLLQQLVVSAGSEGDQRWRDLVSLDIRLTEAGESPDLNQLCATAGVDGRELLAFVGKGVQQMYAGLARLKAVLHAPQIVDLARLAAEDLEKGRGDREMLLKIAGVIEPSGGITINNTANAVAQASVKEELRNPFRRFRDVASEVDEAVRAADDVVDGEVIDEKVN